MLLAVRGRGAVSSGEKVAQDLAKDAAREQLKPMLETACARLASVLYHSYNIAAEHQQGSAGLLHALCALSPAQSQNLA